MRVGWQDVRAGAGALGQRDEPLARSAAAAGIAPEPWPACSDAAGLPPPAPAEPVVPLPHAATINAAPKPIARAPSRRVFVIPTAMRLHPRRYIYLQDGQAAIEGISGKTPVISPSRAPGLPRRRRGRLLRPEFMPVVKIRYEPVARLVDLVGERAALTYWQT
jgi:hypothetical protein